ncbi:hypothetical protein [Stygiolobus caldivivus]|uniref:Uncharacterized protein n=1 Tax=Stygiolobus caldivivus TaxID=2824673 RepID=A0A8D5ZI46_9CREN|nr:hypothetical protein [Stygiolobus caldivivus]BCU70289.1 hypothetical protein KN1_15860 [Stygiolobus caldivivus]
MGLANLMLKHYYGDYTLTFYSDIIVLLSVTLIISSYVLSPLKVHTRLSLIIPDITALYLVLVSKNLTIGLGQDLTEGTFITFLQMRGKRAVFLVFILINVILPYVFFILLSLLIFYLSNFFSSIVYTDFTSYYIYSTGGNLVLTLLLKRPLRSFFIGNLLNVSVIFMSLTQYHVPVSTLLGLSFYGISYVLFLRMQL